MNFSIVVALASGLLAGMSPCLVPLYPALLNRLTRSSEDPRWVTVFFTLGLGGVYFIMYSIIGAAAGILGFEFVEVAETWRGRLTLVGALASWIMAYITLRGGVRIPTIRLLKGGGKAGYLGALATGFVYGSVITPCNAPFVFTGIINAMISRSIVEGMLLLAVFSFSMGLPLIFLGFIYSAAMESFNVLKRNTRKIEVLSALFLILVGFYFLFLFALTLS